MAVQGTRNNVNKPFIVGGQGYVKRGTVAQIPGRGTTAMAIHTLMGYNPSTKKWVPYTNVSATDGTQRPCGILMQSLTAASLVAGDVTDVAILIGNAVIDDGLLVLENSVTLASIITVPTNVAITVEDAMRQAGIYCASTIDITEYAEIS